jgi:dienelactone hydrolase
MKLSGLWAVLVLVSLGGGAAEAARLTAPPLLVVGDAPGILLSDLRPGEQVRVHGLRRTMVSVTEAGQPVQKQVIVHAWADFTADAQGRVALDSAVPIAGTYATADPNGLLWSGWPVGDARLGAGRREDLSEAALAADPALVPRTLLVRVEQAGQLGPGTAVPLTEVMERVQTTELNVERDGVSGVFAAAAGATRRPTLILLHGSEGGSMEAARRQAGRWAERGFAVLALNYVAYQWGTPGIPGVPGTFTNLPVELLDRARQWLAHRPEADGARIGLVGGSKGAELALVGAARLPWVRAVVGCVPSDVVWSGFGREAAPGELLSSWSWAGQPLPYIDYDRYEDVFAGRATAAEVHARSRAAASTEAVAAARIPVERIQAPVLLLGSGRDEVWQSLEMSRNIRAAYERAGRGPLISVREYPEAGHGICGVGTGAARADGQDGGPTAAAAGDAFRATVAFLREKL